MTDDKWLEIYNTFDPTARLEEDQQNLYVERPMALAERIVKRIRREPKGKWIFCGSTGSGKSSELTHLASRLKDRYLVIGLDLHGSVAPQKILTLQPAEVLVLIGAAAVRTAEQGSDVKVPAALTGELTDAFKNVLKTSIDIQWHTLLAGVSLFVWSISTANVPGIMASALGTMNAIKRQVDHKPTPLGDLTRPDLSEGDPDAFALIEKTNAILDHLRDETKLTPLVLVDGLDKIDDIKIIRTLFTASRLLASLRVPTIYAAPIPLMLNTEWQTSGEIFLRERLTNIVVSKPDLDDVHISDDLLDTGRAAMRQVVEKRLRALGCTIKDVFDEQALDELITCSGGVLRVFIRLIREAIGQALDQGKEQITVAEVKVALHEVAHEYDVTMTSERQRELIHIRNEGRPSGDDRAIALLISNYVLPYRNGRTWWWPAPLVARLLPP